MTTQRVHLIRHGETEWSLTGQHTGTTDIPLTENGRKAAGLCKPILSEENFALVLASPLQRARETCALAGLGDCAEIDPDLMEWNYGEYEGLTPQQIHATKPGWMIFADGSPGGESPQADRVSNRSCHSQSARCKRKCGSILAWPFPQSVCGAMDRTSRLRRRPFSTRYGDMVRADLLRGHARDKPMECSAGTVNE